MSTSDAAEFEQQRGGDQRAARGTPPKREQQDDIFSGRFIRDSHRGGLHQHTEQSASRSDTTHKALIFAANRQKQEAAHCRVSENHIQRTFGSNFTSSVYLRLSKNPHLNRPELQKNPDPCLHSLTDPQGIEIGENSSLDTGGASPADTTREAVGVFPVPKKISFPVRQETEDINIVCNGLDTTVTCSDFRNDKFDSHGYHGLHKHPYGSQPERIDSGLLQTDIKDCTRLKKQLSLLELSDPTTSMLSSTVVTVLAPHWSGRVRRTKREEGNGSLEAPANLQDTTRGSNEATCAGEHFQQIQNQYRTERVLTDGSPHQLRMSVLGTRRTTLGWSTKSGPPSINLEYESKRKVSQPVHVDVTSGRIDNRKPGSGALSPLATAPSPQSPFFLDPNEPKNLQTHQEPSSVSSKPTTSSLLLSLRRFNSHSKKSNPELTSSETNPLSLDNSTSDGVRKLRTPCFSQSFHNNDMKERSKPHFSYSSISSKTSDSSPIVPPLSPTDAQGDTFRLSVLPKNKNAESTSFTKHQLLSTTQSSLSCSKHAFLGRGPLDEQQSCRESNQIMDKISDCSITSPTNSRYDNTGVLQSSPLPRNTTLTSTSKLKEVVQEGSSLFTFRDSANSTNMGNTPFSPPCNDNSHIASPGQSDNKIFSSQIPNKTDNDNSSDLVYKGNMSIVTKAHRGLHTLQHSNYAETTDHESHELIKHQHASTVSKREPHILTSSDHKHDVSLLTADVGELPPTLLNQKSPSTPTDSSNKYKNNSLSKFKGLPSPNSEDYQRFASQSPLLKATKSVSSEALSSKTSSIFHPHPSTFAASPTNHPPQTLSLAPIKTVTATPLGFERSYPSIAKSFHPKTMSTLISGANSFSKSDYSPVCTLSATSSITGSKPTTLTVPSPTLVTHDITHAITSPTTSVTISSLLTPPATPIITSTSNPSTFQPQVERKFSDSLENRPKKLHSSVEGKKARRVTWGDSVVDTHCSENTPVEKQDSSKALTNPLSPSRSPQSIKAPSIFSFLRSGSPSTNKSPLCTPVPKTSSIQVGRGGRYRSLSSDSAVQAPRDNGIHKEGHADSITLDQGRADLLSRERTFSEGASPTICHSTASLSLPPDFTSDYKLRYSSPPYSTLMSTRSAAGETKTPRPTFFQQSSDYTSRLSLHSNIPSHTSKLPPSPVSSRQSFSSPFQSKSVLQESSKCDISDSDQVNNNHCKPSNQEQQNGQVVLVKNKLRISSHILQDGKEPSTSRCVTETLVYSVTKDSVAPPNNTTPPQLLTQHDTDIPVPAETKLSEHLQAEKSMQAAGKPGCHSDHSSSGSSSTESQSADGKCRRKENVVGKSRFYSVESNNEQSPKKGRFALKKSPSTPNSSLSRSESEKVNKTNNKVDLVLNKLKQTFSSRRSDDELSFSWRWKRASQTPSVGESGDVSSVSDITVGNKTVEEQDQEAGTLLKDNEKGIDDKNGWTQNGYTLIPSSNDKRSFCSNKSSLESTQDDLSVFQVSPKGQKDLAEHILSESKNQAPLKSRSPTTRSDYKSKKQFLSCVDCSTSTIPVSPPGFTTQFRKSTSSPRSPFSPFSSLSPVSPFSSPDVTDDAVFYSPKPQRHKESSSPCQPGEPIHLVDSRKRQTSTVPSSGSPGQDEEQYADLKYGIVPGRSFSVSSVLSSRPSGPGRISTGTRFTSVGDLCESACSYGGHGKDLDQWPISNDCTRKYCCQHTSDCHESSCLCDPGKIRSRSLPRSLTRCLTNWSSGATASPPAVATTTKSNLFRSPNMDASHFAWDVEGPPTPPPTPPQSPKSRRMSKPPGLSSPTFPTSPGAPQDSQYPKGHLPSKGYVSTLDAFEESSDSSSDTTTDDEYYLEDTAEDEDRETEL